MGGQFFPSSGSSSSNAQSSNGGWYQTDVLFYVKVFGKMLSNLGLQ